MEITATTTMTPSEMGKKSFEARRKKYGDDVMKTVRTGKKFKKKK